MITLLLSFLLSLSLNITLVQTTPLPTLKESYSTGSFSPSVRRNFPSGNFARRGTMRRVKSMKDGDLFAFSSNQEESGGNIRHISSSDDVKSLDSTAYYLKPFTDDSKAFGRLPFITRPDEPRVNENPPPFVLQSSPPKYSWKFFANNNGQMEVSFNVKYVIDETLEPRKSFEQTELFVCPDYYQLKETDIEDIKSEPLCLHLPMIKSKGQISFYNVEKMGKVISKRIAGIDSRGFKPDHRMTLRWVIVAAVPIGEGKHFFMPSPNVKLVQFHSNNEMDGLTASTATMNGEDIMFYSFMPLEMDDDIAEINRISNLPVPISYQDAVNIIRPTEYTTAGFRKKFNKLKESTVVEIGGSMDTLNEYDDEEEINEFGDLSLVNKKKDAEERLLKAMQIIEYYDENVIKPIQ